MQRYYFRVTGHPDRGVVRLDISLSPVPVGDGPRMSDEVEESVWLAPLAARDLARLLMAAADPDHVQRTGSPDWSVSGVAPGNGRDDHSEMLRKALDQLQKALMRHCDAAEASIDQGAEDATSRGRVVVDRYGRRWYEARADTFVQVESWEEAAESWLGWSWSWADLARELGPLKVVEGA